MRDCRIVAGVRMLCASDRNGLVKEKRRWWVAKESGRSVGGNPATTEGGCM